MRARKNANRTQGSEAVQKALANRAARFLRVWSTILPIAAHNGLSLPAMYPLAAFKSGSGQPARELGNHSLPGSSVATNVAAKTRLDKIRLNYIGAHHTLRVT